MRFWKSKQQQSEAKKDRMAALIAAQVISWQTALSKRLNRWINNYTARKQCLLLLLFFAATTLGLAFTLFSNHTLLSLRQRENYIPAHIGKPSEGANPGHRASRTGSITSKK